MKLIKPNLIQYLIVYIVKNMNYYDYETDIDDSKWIIDFRKKMEKINHEKRNLEVELVKCSGLNEKKFSEMKTVIRKKLYENPECKKITEKLVKLIIKKNKLYYSKNIVNYLEKVLKYVNETIKDLKKLNKGKNLDKKMEEINKNIKVYIHDRMKDLKKNKRKKKDFEKIVKEFGFLEKDVDEKIVKNKINELIKSNEMIIKEKKKTIKEFQKIMKSFSKLNKKKIFGNYNKHTLNFI